jgi:serine/threonine protein phosphatase 1
MLTTMSRRFVITDIHGCSQTFKALVEHHLHLKANDTLYLLGDYIDHGPDSKGVLDYIFELQDRGIILHCLRGNHEQLLLRALQKPKKVDVWLKKGGDKVLKSFDCHSPHEIPLKYLSFLESLPYYIELDDCFLVHAGFNFYSPAPFQDYKAMLNIRRFFINNDYVKDKKVIHGHVPKKLSSILKKLNDPTCQNIFLDAGCIYTHKRKMGNLVALELNSMQLYVQSCIDDVELPSAELVKEEPFSLSAYLK